MLTLCSCCHIFNRFIGVEYDNVLTRQMDLKTHHCWFLMVNADAKLPHFQ